MLTKTHHLTQSCEVGVHIFLRNHIEGSCVIWFRHVCLVFLPRNSQKKIVPNGFFFFAASTPFLSCSLITFFLLFFISFQTTPTALFDINYTSATCGLLLTPRFEMLSDGMFYPEQPSYTMTLPFPSSLCRFAGVNCLTQTTHNPFKFPISCLA